MKLTCIHGSTPVTTELIMQQMPAQKKGMVRGLFLES